MNLSPTTFQVFGLFHGTASILLLFSIGVCIHFSHVLGSIVDSANPLRMRGA